MPKTDDDSLGPVLERRLRRELDRVQPRFSSPRYLSHPGQFVGTWRFAPVALAVSLGGILALTASVATGSANPVVWTQRVVTVIEANPTPNPQPSPVERKAAPPAVPSHQPEHEAPSASKSAEPAESPEPRRSAAPAGSAESGDEHSGSSSSGSSDHGSPTPGDS